MNVVRDWIRWNTLGVCPLGGELMDQPYYTVEGFELVESVKVAIQEQQRKDAAANGP